MFEVFLGLGTNLGIKTSNLLDARKHIQSEIGTITAISSLYETEPWGDKNQDNFYNQVIRLKTDIYPLALIKKCLEIEIKMGRVRTQKWAARLIDIDILAISGVQIHTENLVVPHPYIDKRKFVLLPWVEIATEYYLPSYKATLSEILKKVMDESWIKKVNS